MASTTLKTWGFKDSNDATILRVLKRIGFLSDSGESTEAYTSFMKKDIGPVALGDRLRATYPQLFDHIADPARASTEELTNFFNIHSGGSTIQLQVQTFKAMADNARFEGASQPGSNTAMPSSPVVTNVAHENGMPALHIDLHIHLPENKSRTDYDSIFASIAEHILGKKE